MVELSEHFRAARQLLNRAGHMLEELELGHGSADDLQDKISRLCADLETSLSELEELVDGEHSSKREMMKQRLKALSEEHRDVKMGLQKYLKGAAKRRLAARSRAALFAGGADGDVDYTAQEHLGKEASGLNNATNSVENLLQESQAVLESLRSQGRSLNLTSGRLMNIIESSSLSRSILATIRRTERTDALIVYVGILVITFLLGLIWWYK